MNYTPPFNITSDILNLATQISEQVGRLNVSEFAMPPMLRKQNRIKTIAGTLAIEGNTLSEEQVTAILEGKAVMGSASELAEVKGAIQAYEALPQLEPHNVEDLLRAHGLMMSDVLVNAGKFRDSAVGIHKGKTVNHVAPPAHRVSGLIADLIGWLTASKDHPLISSSVFHYEFEFIHPFTDGNGRMGRLWQTLILSKWRPLFLSLPLESVIKDNQQYYYQALEQADEQAESTPFVHFMLSVIAQTLAQNASVNAPVNLTGLKTPEAIIALIQKDPEITRQQMVEILGKDIRTIGRAIAKLQQSGCLKRVGSDKTGHWKMMAEWVQSSGQKSFK